MGALAVFGIENDGLNTAASLLLLVLVVIYLALIYWTFADARRRIDDQMLVFCATLASVFPFVGTIVYLIVRPPEYLADVRERELEIAAAQARLAEFQELACQHCGFEVEKSFLRCPSCLRRLKEPCGVCGKPLDPHWKICPYCEAEVGQVPAEARRPRTRRPATSAAAGQGAQPQRQTPPARQAVQRSSAPRAARPPEPTAEHPTRASRERPDR